MSRNIIVLDLETAYSADDCRHCGRHSDSHYDEGACVAWTGQAPGATVSQFSPIGWRDFPRLGLSIGCYFDYLDHHIHWFDSSTLFPTMRMFTERQPLMVSFNGIGFDFPLMREVLVAQARPGCEKMAGNLCADFLCLEQRSYDLLAEIWKADSVGQYERGLNSLDAIAQANGLGAKLSSGSQAPRDWQAGRWAAVLNYCQADIYLTKTLFEMAIAGQPIRRAGGRDILLPKPTGVLHGSAS